MRVIFRVFILLFLSVPFFTARAQRQKAPVPDADSIEVAKAMDDVKKYLAAFDKRLPATSLKVMRMTANRNSAWAAEQHRLALSNLGAFYTYKGKHDSAKYYYNQLLQVGMVRKDDGAVAKANLGLGMVADYQADYETSIRKNMLALAYFEKVKEEGGIMSTLGNIANSYIRLRQFDRAVLLLNQAIEIATRTNYTRIAANLTSSLARAYKGLGNSEKELELKLKAFSMFQSEGYKKGMATVSINLGVYYEGKGNRDEALKYYYIALKNSRDINDKGNIAILFNNMSDLFLKMGRLDSAVFYRDSAWTYSSRSGDRLSQADALIGKASILHTQGKHEEAQAYQDRFLRLKDSIYNQQMQSQVADMEVKYETEKKQGQIDLLHIENNNKALFITQQNQALLINSLRLNNARQQLINQKLDADKKEQHIKSLRRQSIIQQLEVKNSRLQVKQRNLVIAAILLLVVAGFIAGYFYYLRNQLKQQNRLQAEIYKQQDIANKALFEGEQKERIRLARDLHDSIGQMLSVVKMNVSGLHHQYRNDQLISGTLSLVDETVREVRNISHDLIPEELNFGLINALHDLCERVNMNGSTKATIELAPGISERSFDKGVALSIYRVAQEVLNNMVKHAEATTIRMIVRAEGPRLLITIADNGKGFDVSKIAESTGLGWKNIAARIKLLDGELHIRSSRTEGTHVEISLPATEG